MTLTTVQVSVCVLEFPRNFKLKKKRKKKRNHLSLSLGLALLDVEKVKGKQ